MTVPKYSTHFSVFTLYDTRKKHKEYFFTVGGEGGSNGVLGHYKILPFCFALCQTVYRLISSITAERSTRLPLSSSARTSQFSAKQS